MTEPNDRQAPLRHLLAEDVARLPGDLDFAALDELLSVVPADFRATFISAFAENRDVASDSRGDSGYFQMVRSDDPAMQGMIDRVYRNRR